MGELVGDVLFCVVDLGRSLLCELKGNIPSGRLLAKGSKCVCDNNSHIFEISKA